MRGSRGLIAWVSVLLAFGSVAGGQDLTPERAIEAGVSVDGLMGDSRADLRERVRRVLESLDDSARVRAAMAGVLLAGGDFEGARKLSKEATKQDKDDADAQYVYARSLAMLAMSPETSMFDRMSYGGSMKKAAERAIESDPSHEGAYELLIQFHTFAPGIAGGSKSKARRLIGVMESFAPARAARLSLGLLLAEEDWDAAEREYARLSASSSLSVEDKAGIHARYAQGLIFSKADYEQAERVLRAFEASPGDDAWLARYLWARLHEAREEWAMAIERYKDVVVLRSDAENTLFRIATCYDEMGRPAEARVWYDRYLAKAPEGRHADEAAERAKKLAG